jgi:release factor glutamine methyltransferase
VEVHVQDAIAEVERKLAAAGIRRARENAELLVAYAAGVRSTELPLADPLEPEAASVLCELTASRASRIPLHYLTGTASFGGVDLEVGRGVFVPRRQTEPLLAWGLEALRDLGDPVVVDLCAGSGAIALAVAHARPDATVHAVENDPEALRWAEHNLAVRARAGDTPVLLHAGDVGDPALLAELEGVVDLVLCNPPYVAVGRELIPEYAEHHPEQSVFAGADGLDVIRDVVECARRLLRPGGAAAIEHDDPHAEALPALLRATSAFTEVVDRLDQDERPRFTTARRRPEAR